MKKRIAFALCMVMMIFMLGACGTDPTTVDYNGYSYDELKSELYYTANMAQSIVYTYEEQNVQAGEVPEDLVSELMNYGVTELQLEAAERWMEISEQFGELKSADEDSFKVTKSGKTLTTDLTLNFEKKDVNFQVVYNYYDMEITGITIEPVYSLPEKLQKAGMNTLISMSVVFAVLILISLLIACFKIFPYMEEKKANKKAAKALDAASASEENQVVSQIAQREEQQQADDTELIAVIAAAIAASTGTSTSDFVVRSINRR